MTPYALAARYTGIAELSGGVHHPLIQWWLLKAGLPLGSADEVPWCGAFANNIFWECGLSGLQRPTLPARARYWMRAGQPIELKDAKRGWDIVVLSRGDGAPGPDVFDAPGHVAFFDSLHETTVTLLGGNQHDQVCLATFPQSRVLAVRRLGEGEV